MPFVGIPLLIVSHWEQIKSFFTGLIDWFRNVGGNIIKAFTDGITSFINSPFEAVKAALDKVRQLLPFSDAKEGPLSDLTLSGSRVFTTFNDGMTQTADLPTQTVDSAFGNMDTTVSAQRTTQGDKESKDNQGLTISQLVLGIVGCFLGGQSAYCNQVFAVGIKVGSTQFLLENILRLVIYGL